MYSLLGFGPLEINSYSSKKKKKKPSRGPSFWFLLSTGVVFHSLRECYGFCLLGVGHFDT